MTLLAENTITTPRTSSKVAEPSTRWYEVNGLRSTRASPERSPRRSPLDMTPHRGSEGIPSRAVVGEHVPGRARRGQQHGVAVDGMGRRSGHDPVHDRAIPCGVGVVVRGPVHGFIVDGWNLDNGDMRRVSGDGKSVVEGRR